MIERYSDHAANERTFLAWVRTAIAIMAFGFLVQKFDLFLKIASASLSVDLVQFAGDELEELRAAAARAMSSSPSLLGFEVLNELARDPGGALSPLTRLTRRADRVAESDVRDEVPAFGRVV